MDRISELPEPIKEKILLTLSTKDAIRMSFSSREWQSAWNSWRSFIGTLSELEGQRNIVRFSLVNPVAKKMTESDVDLCIKMLIQNYVTELRLIMARDLAAYKFPNSTFDVGLLTRLELGYCTLDSVLVQKDTIFCCLKELRLWYVKLNGLVIRQLLPRCPLLENLELMQCINILPLELCDILNLKNVALNLDLYGLDEYQLRDSFKIEAPNLESLVYRDSKTASMDLKDVCCRNLKKLEIAKKHCQFITSQYIKELFRKFPFLEELVLADCVFGHKGLEFSCSQLKKLRIYEACRFVKNSINIDAPNLVSFEIDL